MPTYVYKCNECGQEFEKVTSMADKDKVDCEKCGGAVARMLTSFNFLAGTKPSLGGGPRCLEKNGGSCPQSGGG
jgi:putative FmdB family regulatory protein